MMHQEVDNSLFHASAVRAVGLKAFPCRQKKQKSTILQPYFEPSRLALTNSVCIFSAHGYKFCKNVLFSVLFNLCP